MATKNHPKDHSTNFACGVIESLTINLLAILLEKGVLNRQEANKLIAGMKSDLRVFRGGTEAARADALAGRLDDLARSLGISKAN
jgi:hypothetical protein